jgi:exonuclease VII large subunit
MNISEAIRAIVVNAKQRLHEAYEQVVKIEPHRLLARQVVFVNELKNRVLTATGKVIGRRTIEITACENRLAALNPKSVLHRGYSITTSSKTGLLVRTAGDVEVGDYLFTELAGENLIESRVTKK